jgi:diacylglycerol kinase family enzyme
MINIGFDCEVVKRTADLKKSKLVPKSLTYIVGLVLTLIRKPGVKAGLSIDGKEGQRCDMLLTSAGNGAFCGGGFHSTPRASLCDGIMDAVIIRNVSRIKFLSLVGAYKNGTYVTDPKADGVIEYVKCRSIKYEFDGVQSICVDGEVEDVTELELSVAKGALRLIVPYGVAYRPAEENSAAGVC